MKKILVIAATLLSTSVFAVMPGQELRGGDQYERQLLQVGIPLSGGMVYNQDAKVPAKPEPKAQHAEQKKSH